MCLTANILLMSTTKKSMNKTVGVLAVIIIILLGGIVTLYTQPSTTGETVVTQTVTQTAAAAAGGDTASSGPLPIPDTLIIDENHYPFTSVNQLLGIMMMPWPNVMLFTHYQTLVVTDLTEQFDNNNIIYKPSLATSWDITNQQKYTFHLREGVTFHNGDAFNAYQVWAWMYGHYWMGGNETNFMYGLDLFDMSNVEYGPATVQTLTDGGIANPNAASKAIMENSDWPIHVVDEYTIEMNLKNPFNQDIFLAMLVGHQGMIYDAQYVFDNGGYGHAYDPNPYFDTNPIPGTGPYTITDLEVDAYIKFSQYDGYWGKDLTKAEINDNPAIDPGHVKNVVINIQGSDLARYTDLTTGDAHMAAILAENFKLVQNNPQYEYASLKEHSRVIKLGMNTQIHPTDNVDVRRAIVRAIDYEAILDRAFFGEGSLFFGPQTPSFGKWYNPGNTPIYERNIDEALAYLETAGYPNGEGLPTFTYWIPPGNQFEIVISQIIQANLLDIGINVEISTKLESGYWEIWCSYQCQIDNGVDKFPHLLVGTGYAPDYIGVPNFWSQFVSKYSTVGNIALYSNPVVDDAVALFSTTADEDTIMAALIKAEQQLYEDAPYAWLAAPSLLMSDGSYAWNKDLIDRVYFDPNYIGVTQVPIFNTVIFDEEDW